MPLVRVASTQDIPPDQCRLFFVGEKAVVIAHQGGRFFAVDGVCPHKGFELEGATLWEGVIECPWHHYQYDLRTGQNRVPSDIYPRALAERIEPIRTYPVEVRESEIWLDLETG